MAPIGLGMGMGLGLGTSGRSGQWTPAKIAPLAWYQLGATVLDGDGAAADAGELVAAWNDSSANGNNLAQILPGTGGRPTLHADGYLLFDGAAHALGKATLSGTAAQPLRMFVLGQLVTISSDDMIIGQFVGSTVVMFRRTATSRLTAVAGGTTGDLAWDQDCDTEQHLYEVLFSGAGSKIYLDGVEIATGNAGTTGLTGLAIGAGYTISLQKPANIKVWEALVLQGDAASDSNASKVRLYFASKFGVFIAGLLVSLTLQTTETFGSGLLPANPSSTQAIAKTTVSGGAEYLFIGDQDMSGLYGTARRGCAHVWKKTDGAWVYHEQLLPDGASWTGAQNMWMGHCVAASGDWLACGNTHQNLTPDVGEGYVEMWKHNSGTDAWELAQRIQPDEIEDEDEFGLAVDVAGEWLAAGAPYHAVDAVERAGKVWVYQLIDGVWTAAQEITEPVPTQGNNFGLFVHLSGDHLFIRSHAQAVEKYFQGTVHHYMLSDGTWTYVGEIVPASRVAQQRYGMRMKFDGASRLAVTSYGLEDYVDGGLHVFLWDGEEWTEEFSFVDTGNTLQPVTEFHRWGGSLAIGDGIIAAGCRFAAAQTWSYTAGNDGKGAVYVFRRLGDGDWYRTEYSVGDQHGDYFGESVLLDGDGLLVVSSGATRDETKTMILQKFSL